MYLGGVGRATLGGRIGGRAANDGDGYRRMGVTRREFLHTTGLVLAGWGLGNFDLGPWRDRYQAALAIPTPRKLALLVGINQYGNGTKLEGCLTDVELQRELLIHRFGFQPADIVVLTDKAATRQGVETAFVEHLINQAQAGDVVVFHFSGLGSVLPGPTLETTQNTLVMADPVPLTDAPIVNDLLEETLWLLVRSLKTDKVTTVLDTSYQYPGKPLQGNLRIRSYPNPSVAQAADTELAFQDQFLRSLGMDREQLQIQRRSGMLRGLLLTAAKAEEVATEGEWYQDQAGLFTAALTQSLWQTTVATSLRTQVRLAAEQVAQFAAQQHPQIQGQKSQEPSLVPYFTPVTTPVADGVILAVEENGKAVRLWLGGLAAPLLANSGESALFAVVPAEGAIAPDPPESPMLLQVTSRSGFTAKGKLYTGEAVGTSREVALLQPGLLVRETVRILPRNIGLTVALDGCLERIERVDAVSAFSAIPHVSAAIAGTQTADYLFSKVQSHPAQVATLPSDSFSVQAASTTTYGLFSPGRDILLGTTSDAGEAIKGAVRRLTPKLRTLLATKLLSLTENSHTSRLGVRVQLEMLAPQERVLLEQQTSRSPIEPPPRQNTPAAQTGQVLQVPVGSRLRYRIENYGPEPLYLLAMGLASANHLIWFAQKDETLPLLQANTPTAIAPGETLLLPSILAGSEWKVQKTTGVTETYLICSRAPFTQTLAVLDNQPRLEPAPSGGTTIPNPLEVAQAVLQDLTQASSRQKAIAPPDSYVLDVDVWATLQFVYQIV